MKKAFTLILLFFCFCNIGYSQGKFVIQNKKGSDKIRFKLINNLIVIPVEINGVELSFLLDTGVSKPIIFNFLNVSDTLKIKDAKKIYLRGLGEGESVEALKSKNNVFKVGDAIKLNQDLYAVYDANLNFAPRLGVPVHGILGFDLFKDFVVEINYSHKYIKITDPDKNRYKPCKKCERFNLEFYNNKPYINAKVKINNKQIPVKLLIDSGGSDALWLFEDEALGITSSNRYFDDFLGHGLSGSVYGKRSKIDEFSLNSFVLKRANVAYPDSTSILFAKKISGRNGSLAGNILKRFNIVLNYQEATVTLHKNGYFNDKFSYNKSGIELAHDGVRFVKERENIAPNKNSLINETNQNQTRIVFDSRYKFSLKPAYAIVELRTGSPAHLAGLKNGDIILSVNSKPAHQFTLQQIMQIFYAEDGKKIKLKIDRNGVVLNYSFILKDFFK
ncbi:aspartyl protease family protein [Gelatiniphilus marinus]|uniref:Aspartyl protease family protein n=1 Tax=Gelatiniphilus marinus TaxID=1759464 RepID=A0ABW5JQ47_9FLAO